MAGPKTYMSFFFLRKNKSWGCNMTKRLALGEVNCGTETKKKYIYKEKGNNK